MSEVKRYTAPYASVNEDEFGLYVRIDAYTQVQCDMAALREELAVYSASNERVTNRLTSSEKRNRTLEILLRRASNYGGLTPEWHDAVKDALAQTTESGASE